MTTPVERPSTPPLVTVLGTIAVIVIGFLVLKWIIGFVFTIAKLAIVLAIVVGAVTLVARFSDNDS